MRQAWIAVSVLLVGCGGSLFPLAPGDGGSGGVTDPAVTPLWEVVAHHAPVMDLSWSPKELHVAVYARHAPLTVLQGGTGALVDRVAELVRDVTCGRMADVAFEVTGDPGLPAQAAGVLREQGRLVILSSPRGPSTIDLHDHCMRPSITIVGAHNFSHPQVATLADPWVLVRHAEAFFDLVRHGLLDVDRLISDRVPVREAPALYGRLMRDRSGVMGVVVGW